MQKLFVVFHKQTWTIDTLRFKAFQKDVKQILMHGLSSELEGHAMLNQGVTGFFIIPVFCGSFLHLSCM